MTGFTIRVESSKVFNFLVYIQNLFINQIEQPSHPKFPYIPSFSVNFHPKFERNLLAISQHFLNLTTTDCLQHFALYNDGREEIFHQLFETEKATFDEVRRSFESWWETTGNFTTERAVDTVLDQLYVDVSSIIDDKNIMVSIGIVYDEFLFQNKLFCGQAGILSVKECFRNYEKVVSKISGQLLM